MDEGSQESLYRLVAENATDVIYLGRRGVMRWLSPALTHNLRWRPEQWEGRRLEEFTHPDDVALLQERRAEITAGARRVMRLRLRDSDGSWHWVEFHAGPAIPEEGDPVNVVATFRVIDEMVASENALAEAEARYRLIAENTADVVVQSVDGLLVWISPSVEALTGWTPQDLLGKTTAHLWHPDDRELAVTLRDASYNGQPSRDTLRLRRKDGGYVWVDFALTPYTGPDGAAGAVGSLRDVTSEVSARQQLEAERQRLQAMFGSMLEPHVLLRAVRSDSGAVVDFEYTDANPAAAEFMGTTATELIGLRVLGLWPGNLGQEIVQTYEGWLSSGQPVVLDDWAYPHQEPGNERFFDIRATQVDDSMLFAWREVTERHEAVARIAASEREYRLLAENAADLVIQMDETDSLTWVSPSLHRLLGYLPEEMLGEPRWDFVHPCDVGLVRESLLDLRTGERSVASAEVRLRHRHGRHSWWSLTVRRTSDDPATSGIVLGLVDIDAEVRARLAAQEQQATRVAALDSMLDPHVMLRAVTDVDGEIVDFVYDDANAAACAYLGMTREGVVGTRVLDLLPANVNSGLFEMYADVVRTGESLVLDDFEYTHEVLSEKRRYDIRVVKVGDGLSCTWRDVTERHEAAQRIEASEARYRLLAEQYRVLAENATDVVFRIDPNSVITYCSDGILRLLGLPAEEVVGTFAFEYVHPEDRDDLEASCRIPGRRPPLRVRLRTAEETFIWAGCTATTVTDDSGRRLGIVGGLRDVDAEVHAQQELQERACTDPLTGLLNRAEAFARLDACLSRPTGNGVHLALAFVDLDGLKTINDTWGHAAGDALIRTSAERIRGVVREGDLVARVGGDEILVVLPGVHGLDEAAMIAEKVRHVLAAPVVAQDGGPPLPSSASIGVTVARSDDSADILVARADLAMYEAKKQGDSVVTSDGAVD